MLRESIEILLDRDTWRRPEGDISFILQKIAVVLAWNGIA